mgnify:FL=1
MAKTKTETRKLFKRDVPVSLSEDDALALHDKAEADEQRADELEAELKTETKTRKARIDELRAGVDRDRAAAAKREQLVNMDCYEELQGSQMFVRRADTHEVIDQRAATADERQQDFPGLDKGGDIADDESTYTPDPSAPMSPEERTTRRGRKAKS